MTGARTCRALLSVQMRTMRPASGKSIGCRTSVLKMLSIAVSAPTPIAMVSTAIAVKAGDLRSDRTASVSGLMPTSYDRCALASRKPLAMKLSSTLSLRHQPIDVDFALGPDVDAAGGDGRHRKPNRHGGA